MMRIMGWRMQERHGGALMTSDARKIARSGPALSSRFRARTVFKIGTVTLLFAAGALCHLFTVNGRPPGLLIEALLGPPEVNAPQIAPSGAEQGQPRRLCESSPEQQERDKMKVYMVNRKDLTLDCTVKDGVCLKKGKEWMIVLYILGVFYMFIALAIVCDEFFVPSLECFVEELGISMDVAGATFMAAGGSMPELFTSFIGTYTDSNIGFAAIVGSAVFNVLFVIGVCAVASTEVLKLTWWPLARDCFFYVIGLGILFVFLDVSSEEVLEPDGKKSTVGKIYPWQAAVLLAFYIGYCVFMKFSSQVEELIKTKVLKQEIQVADEKSAEDSTNNSKANAHFLMPSSFRMGIVQVLAYGRQSAESAGIAAVTQIEGDVEETFAKVDKDSNGVITDDEMRELLSTLGIKPDSKMASEAMRTLDRQRTGQVTREEFRKWYHASEARIQIEARNIFDQFDDDKDGFIGREELGQVLKRMGISPTEDDLDRTVKTICDHADAKLEEGKAETGTNGNEARITFEQFDQWYHNSLFWQNRSSSKDANGADEEEGFNIEPPENAGWIALSWYVISYPLCALMYISMPDVRRPKNAGNTKVAVLEFILSLFWIAFFSFCLVDWLTVASNTLGIPAPVAGVTLLAAGTSIPDLLSSYIVAKEGQGDMAVSSSIGSNIFDILVGLPLPWLSYSLIHSRPIEVGTASLKLSILLLIVMLVSVIVSVMCMHWRMTKTLGYVMFGLYIFFMVQQLVRQLPDESDPWVKIPDW